MSEYRDQAVRNVDKRHGYTAEHSPDPVAHREEYDAEEKHLRDPDTVERWTVYLCGNCGAEGSVDAANENDAHCFECNEWMNTEAVPVVPAAALERAEAERQAILDCINLYGDETLHAALDDAGLLSSIERSGDE